MEEKIIETAVLSIMCVIPFIGIIILCIFGIIKHSKRLKDCENSIIRCRELFEKDKDNNWIYLESAWKDMKTDTKVVIWVISFTAAICVVAIGYLIAMMVTV